MDVMPLDLPCHKYGKYFPLHAMKAYRESRHIAPFILNLSSRWEVNG